MAAKLNLHRVALLLILLMRRRRRRLRAACRTTWSKTWIQKRQGHGVYANLLRELQADDPEAFRQYHRLDVNAFKEVLRMVGRFIFRKDTVMRASICPEERLAVTLRFLATGMLYVIVHKGLDLKKIVIIKLNFRRII